MKALLIFSCFTIICFSMSTQPASAQSRQQLKTDSVFQLVKKAFNARQTATIYAMAGDNFHKNIDANKFRNIAEQNLYTLGEMKATSLISFVNNKVATYKVNFSTNLIFQLLISLDDNDKLDLFLFQPYTDVATLKTETVATSNPLNSVLDKEIDTVARQYIQKINTVGLSIGIFKDGKTHTYNYGEITQGLGQLPNENSLFEIGSITKTFTATLLAYYVNEGKVKLSDPITKYLPDSVASNPELGEITLLDLINHTSGLAVQPDNLDLVTDPQNPFKKYNRQMLFAYLKKCKLNTIPGEKYAYSNAGVGLLGVILENVSERTYSHMVAEYITGPLAMSSTVQKMTPELELRFVTLYNDEGQQTSRWDFDALAAAGSLRSTVSDLLTYAEANMEGRTTKLAKAMELTHHITYNKDVKLGMAWHMIIVNGVEYYFHNGGTYGSSSFLTFNKQKDVAVVVFSNSGQSTDNVGVEILKKLQ